jgi:hypothetical protein
MSNILIILFQYVMDPKHHVILYTIEHFVRYAVTG